MSTTQNDKETNKPQSNGRPSLYGRSPGPIAVSLLTKARDAGELAHVDWMAVNVNQRNWRMVEEAQKILVGWTGVEVMNAWIEVEALCEKFREENNCSVVDGQEWLVVNYLTDEKGKHAFKMATDTGCFAYMGGVNSQDYHMFMEAISSDWLVSFKKLMAIELLYENHFEMYEEATGSLAVLKECQLMAIKPDADSGKASREGGKKGNEAQHGTEAERLALSTEYQTFMNSLFLDNPQWSYTRLSDKAGKEFGCSGKTIRRNTTDPTKK